jgi:beta-lactamase regulating signal transducer with metallopeptidase domain
MGPILAFAIEDLGWFVVHYLWAGAVIGVLAVLIRWAWPGATPKQRYAFSLSVLALLVLAGVGLVLAVGLPREFWERLGFTAGLDLPAWFLPIIPLLPQVWGIVSLLLFALLTLGMVGTWRLRLATTEAPQSIRNMAEELARRWNFSRTIPVRICRRIGEPILMGIFRPMILLPPAVLLKCRPDQLELILLHELGHVRRRDNIVLLLQRAAEVLFWFQPAVWMVSRWVTRDREFCCDQFVLKEAPDRRLYAETLISLARMGRPQASPFLAVFFGREHVFARIRYILNSEEAAMSRSRSLAQVVVLSLAAVFGLLALSSPEPQAVAEPPAASVQPAIAVPVVVPEISTPVVVPNPVVPNVVVPRRFGQKTQILVDPVTGEVTQAPAAAADPAPAPGAAPQEGAVSQANKRAWGPEQAVGAPDTPGAGDIQTAWASLTQDGQKEWLICEYAEPVLATAIVVHETYNPGSLEKVSVFDEEGQEQEVWTGTDPTPRTAARGISIIPIKTKFNVQKIKLYLDSPAVPGWNEIDAIGLRSKDDNMQWATKVIASTTYAEQTVEPQPPMVVVPLEQLQKLQQDVDDLKKELERMKQMEADLKELKELVKDLKK